MKNEIVLMKTRKWKPRKMLSTHIRVHNAYWTHNNIPYIAHFIGFQFIFIHRQMEMLPFRQKVVMIWKWLSIKNSRIDCNWISRWALKYKGPFRFDAGKKNGFLSLFAYIASTCDSIFIWFFLIWIFVKLNTKQSIAYKQEIVHRKQNTKTKIVTRTSNI